MGFPFFKQYDAMDCGPTCLQMIAKHYGKKYPLEFLREQCFLTREGVSLLGISEAAEKIGFRTMAVKVPLKKMVEQAPLPTVLHWNQQHFVVLYKVKKDIFFIADPAHGLIKLSKAEFLKSWSSDGQNGIALLIEPTEEFVNSSLDKEEKKKGFSFLFPYLRPYKSYIVQLILSMVIAGGLSLIFPFLTQSLVDFGIQHQNIGFVKLILFSQLALFIGSTAIEMIRAWLMLHMNNRIQITLISDFLWKLMRLPMKFFDTKLIGDIKQRINDHNRVQSFLTGTALSTLFSSINMIVFMVVLGIYSLQILGVFISFSVLGVIWILLFLKRRKKLDYLRFQKMSDNEDVLFELITGMQEVKLNNAETKKRWGWERVQAQLFHVNIKSLALGQYQQIGSVFFNQSKNIFISYIAAMEVIGGSMTLGMMLSVSYIIGQLNSPIQQILGFVQDAQDAKISLDRLSEIHSRKNEDDGELSLLKVEKGGNISFDNLLDNAVFEEEESLIGSSISHRGVKGIKIENLSFQYEGSKSPYVLKDINLLIPEGKVTAIVGTSGSGKTTLIKLLLKFYDPQKGELQVNDINLKQIPPRYWRSQCGSVMQEGMIFSDTIAQNIAVSDDQVDYRKLSYALKIANIYDFVQDLPLGVNTKIGNSGSGISTGQKQRLLIARAIYKSPNYLFFDEATSALDAANERTIIENLNKVFENKTVVVVAHRLSTVKHADQIVVLEKGELVELGTHESLVAEKGKYYNLVKNQLELGS